MQQLTIRQCQWWLSITWTRKEPSMKRSRWGSPRRWARWERDMHKRALIRFARWIGGWLLFGAFCVLGWFGFAKVIESLDPQIFNVCMGAFFVLLILGSVLSMIDAMRQKYREYLRDEEWRADKHGH